MVNKRTVLGLRIVGLIFIVLSALYFLNIAYTDISTNRKQAQLKKEWDQTNKKTVSANDTNTACKDEPTIKADMTTAEQTSTQSSIPHTPIPIGKPFARIVIPRINLDAIVLQGVDQSVLQYGPGHMEETAFPGDTGNIVISGHRVTHSHPFYDLDTLTKGDPIDIYSGSQKFTYYVAEQKVVKPTDVSVIKPTKDKTLTLTTCNPRYSARTRLIIVAKMQ